LNTIVGRKKQIIIKTQNMPISLLITGANGQLGFSITKLFLSFGYKVLPLGKSELDITDRAEVAKTIAAHAPQIIINCAAYNQVELAEENIKAAFAVNASGPFYLAKSADSIGARFVHISTDYVFDGELEFYSETDPARPINAYGASKFAGEQLVQAACPSSIIIRTSWLFGTSSDAGSHNFVKKMLQAAQNREEINMVDDQYGKPTYAGDLALKIKELLEEKNAPSGIYHITNASVCSRYEFAKEIFSLAGLSAKIMPQSTRKSGSKVLRPKFVALENKRLMELGLAPMRPWQEALADYLKEIRP